jgi:hypothetical protein
MTRTRRQPTVEPPEAGVGAGNGGVGTTKPKPPTDQQLKATLAPAAATGQPALLPPGVDPGVAAGAAVGAVTGTWRSGVTVTALWSINETRNAWMYVPSLGWRKLFNGKDGAFNALVTLASQARQTGRTVNLREEADGMVYEIYLW